MACPDPGTSAAHGLTGVVGRTSWMTWNCPVLGWSCSKNDLVGVLPCCERPDKANAGGTCTTRSRCIIILDKTDERAAPGTVG